MDGGRWLPTRWAPEQLEKRRLASAALLRQGRLSQAAIARQFGVSGASVPLGGHVVPVRRDFLYCVAVMD